MSDDSRDALAEAHERFDRAIGELPDGTRVRLASAVRTLDPVALRELVVDVRGVGRVRPWRFASLGSELRVGADGVVEV